MTFQISEFIEDKRWHCEGLFGFQGELKGTLHVKLEDKKSWKSFIFLMQPSGMFFYPKGKGKVKDLSPCCAFCLAWRFVSVFQSEPTCYLDLPQQTGLEVFFGIGWKKKLKAPSEFGFAVKVGIWRNTNCIIRDNYGIFLANSLNFIMVTWG